jgi:two-component system, OmpR family, alkaline phosphatase synthesis response regulator PhoP
MLPSKIPPLTTLSSTERAKAKSRDVKLKILVVDDTLTIRLHTKMIIEGLGHEIFEAVDGYDALSKTKLNSPHLVLMDIMMPNMDGIECCRQIKSDPNLKETKVIMVTSKTEMEKINAAFKAGCDDYVNKPIDPKELLKKIAELSTFISCRQRLRE